MTSDPLTLIGTRVTTQSEPIPGTVANSAGGHAFPVDDWTRLRRFLILGSEGGSYYASEPELTKENAAALLRCVSADGHRVVRELVEISLAGRAAKQNPTMFALAACAGAEDVTVRQAALKALPDVCRTGTHLFLFARYVEQFRGWGRSLRDAVAGWYTSKPVEQLTLQLAKYRQREGWSHRDLLRLSKPRPERDSEIDLALRWAVGKNGGTFPAFLRAVDAVQAETDRAVIAGMVTDHRLPWEVLPSDSLTSPVVWRALLPTLRITALVRNLGRMTANGALTHDTAAEVVARLTDAEEIRRSRIHPLNILNALTVYATGHGDRGSLTWPPVPAVIDALSDAFPLAFVNVEPAGKRTMLALDVSGSMGSPILGSSSLTARDASGAMALVTLATEPVCRVVAFTGAEGTPPRGSMLGHRRGACVSPLGLSPRQRLDDVIRSISGLPFGPTDCALPMLHALEHGYEVDTFVIYTDSETWFGNIHPVQALRLYRERTGIPARLVVVGMVSNGFSIADPADAGMLDVVGFDSAAPGLIADFSAGRI